MWDIWRVSWDDSSHTCGPAECLGPNVNSADIEFGVCFSADGQRMYFDTDTHYKNGQYNYGSDDIWYVDWDSTLSDWGVPYNLGPLINTTDLEEFPYISADGNYLYFSCPGGHHVPGWQGEFDIYRAVKNGNTWEYVENLLPPINSATWDLGASISPNNLKLYFCTHRNRDPNADYEIMVSTWELEGIEDDSIEQEDNTIKLDLYPNPFNEQVGIRLGAYGETKANIKIYDIAGQKVRQYAIELRGGAGMATSDGKNQQGQKVGTGNYIVKIEFPDGIEMRRVITLLK